MSAVPAKSAGSGVNVTQKKRTPNKAIKAANVSLVSIVTALAVFVGAVVAASIFAPEKLDAVARKLPKVLQDIVFWIVAHKALLGALSITLLAALLTKARVAVDEAVYDAAHR
jgi:hypothetical protein